MTWMTTRRRMFGAKVKEMEAAVRASCESRPRALACNLVTARWLWRKRSLKAGTHLRCLCGKTPGLAAPLLGLPGSSYKPVLRHRYDSELYLVPT